MQHAIVPTQNTLPLATAGTLCLPGSMRPTLAALLGVAWYVTPRELEEWARESLFGTHPQRQHLRDDLHAFDQLSVIQNQRKEPAHA